MRNIIEAVLLSAWLLLWPAGVHGQQRVEAFKEVCDDFYKGYTALNIPAVAYDYHEYFNSIPSVEQLQQQKDFFNHQQAELAAVSKASLGAQDRLYYEHLAYEINFNLERVALETQWVQQGRKVPEGGLYTLENSKDWYSHFIRQYTSTGMTPEEVFALGMSETKRMQQEIKRIERQLGYTNDTLFYRHLQDDTFFLTDKEQIVAAYEQIDKTVRHNLYKIVHDTAIPPIEPMEWPDAGPNTPPGIYLDQANNPYGRDVFQFNFYRSRHNKRGMEWLYMHEAIPGHHLQFSYRAKIQAPEFQKLFLYPGNFEGWGCYVEYLGKTVGLYKDPYSELGKWQWDLVRSVRLVLDAGVHYYGWSRAQAMQFWKENIYGQDDIADREITRITNWPCQALSYKVGAHEIEKMRAAAMKKNPQLTLADFHQRFLAMSYFPLEVVAKWLDTGY